MRVETWTLTNGLRCALKPHFSSELVSIQFWVGVGSIDERANERGMAHLLEHMLFKGTERFGVGEIARRIEAAGGDINAYTTFDRTVYYATIPADQFEYAADILADAVFHSRFDPEELEKEKEVVIEEIRRSLDQPSTLSSRKIFSHVFAGCEAERPIIGSVESVKAFSREAILDFYKGWYQPANIQMIVAGAIDHQRMSAFAQEKLSVKTASVAPRSKNIHTRQFPQGVQVEVLKGDFQQPKLEITFEAPPYTDESSIHLDLCSYALGSGEASRLTRRLRDQKNIVAAISASTYTPGFGGIMMVSAYPFAERIPEAIQAVVGELHQLRWVDPLTEEELSHAKTNIRTEYVYQGETVGGQARNLGFNLSTPFGKNYDRWYLSAVECASVEDVMHAYRHWIHDLKVVITVSIPESMELDARTIRQAYMTAIEKPQIQKTSTKSSVQPQQSIRSIHDQLTLIYRQIPESPFWSAALVQPGGQRFESTPGMQHAMGSMLGRASRKYAYDQILHHTERTAASLDGFSGRDSIGLRLQCLQEFRYELLPVWLSCFLDPMFPEEQWRASQLEIIEDIKSEDDHPSQTCFREFQRRLYHTHPYAQRLSGDIDQVRSWSVSDLETGYIQHRNAAPLIVSACGAAPVEEFAEWLETELGSWRPQLSQTKVHSPKPIFGHHHIAKNKEQTHIAIGMPGATWASEHRYALDILSTVLSGQGGRLFLDLRDRQSLAYSVSALCSSAVDAGVFGAYIACAPSKAEHAQEELMRKLEECLAQAPSDEEMSRAKNYLIASHAVEMQRSSSQSMNMALMHLYGLGYDEFLRYSQSIRDTSKEQVMAAAQTIIRRDRAVIVSVGEARGKP